MVDSRLLFSAGSDASQPTAAGKLLDFGLPDPVDRLAKKMVGAAESLVLSSDAFDGGDGSVALTFYDGDRCLEVAIEPDCAIAFSVKDGVGFDFDFVEEEDSASYDDILDWLYKLSGRPVWNSSELSVQIGGTSAKVALSSSRSSEVPVAIPTPPMGTAEFLFSISLAPLVSLQTTEASAGT